MEPSENVNLKTTSISFQELLQKAEDGNLLLNGSYAAFENRLFHSVQVPQMHPYDLNLTPETMLGFEPVTPDKSTRSVNSNIDETAHSQIERQSTTTPENQNLATVESQGTDPSTTPKQKQRRKKHRPKVVSERKPRAPKPTVATPAAAEDPPRKKRKYVRKNPNEKKASDTPTELKRSPKKRPCRRALNFDEMDSEDEYSASVGSEQGGRRLCTRGISKVTVQLCQQIEEITAQNAPCSTSPKGFHVISDVNLTELNEFKGNYSHAVQQLNFGVNVHGVHYDSVQAYRLISWQNYKKKRSVKGLKNILGPRDEQNNGRIVIDISPSKRPTKKRSRSSTKSRDLASLNRIAEQAMSNSCTAEQPESCVDALKAQIMTTLATKKRTKKINVPAVQYSGFQQLCTGSGVLREVGSTQMLSVDDIERQLKSLDINRESSEIPHPPTTAVVPFSTKYKELNTLVLYKGDVAVVPFTPIKKSRPRPKVDLDEETTRVWKLLLENINSEGIDGTDEAKAKWWQEERRVFHGRAESFIARMHLVQGDRRFSKWKGSVLDSVVGVFLTQNVSDHLSSSAFMYLASRYPLKLGNRDKACRVADETEELISDQDALNQPRCGGHSTPSVGEESDITGPERIEASRSNTEEEENPMIGLVSVQTVSDFSTPQMISKTGSCSESNSDEDDMAKELKAVSLEEPASLLENQQVETSDNTLSNDFIAYKATENEEYSENMGKSGPSKESLLEPSTSLCSCKTVSVEASLFESFETLREEAHSSDISQSTITVETQRTTSRLLEPQREHCKNTIISDSETIISDSESRLVENLKSVEITDREEPNLPNHSEEIRVVVNDTPKSEPATSKAKSGRVRKEKIDDRDWDQLRKKAEANCRRQRTENTMDSLDWEAIRCADVDEVADTIKERGMNNKLAQRIKDFLDRLVKDHGSIDLEWLRDVPPDQAKEYLLSIRGLGLKSVECVRLLTLHHLAFPVDTNVGRIAVRLGWVPLQPLPESLQLHLLELYPVLETIQKYLWPRLCKLDQKTLYELHYQMITFGKVFCTKNKPNCNACPMRGECRHFASAFASARLALPGPEEKSITVATESYKKEDIKQPGMNERPPLLQLPAATKQTDEDKNLVESSQSEIAAAGPSCCEPIIEEPLTPELGSGTGDIEDFFPEDPEEIPTIKLSIDEFAQTLQNYMQNNMELRDGDMSKALVAINPNTASIPMPKLKNVDRLRTEHHVYELPDSHPLLERLEMEKRETDDPSPYLLAIWTPGETPNSITPPENRCSSHALGKLCNDEECFSCNSIRESDSQTVRGTLLIPCRTAMRGSFPLNGTYFQVNEVFADHDSSLNPIDVPRAWIWNLNRRTVYFGTSIPTIFRGLTTQGIQHCFWRGYVCVRGFDQKSRAPRPLKARLHCPASKGKLFRDPKTDE